VGPPALHPAHLQVLLRLLQPPQRDARLDQPERRRHAQGVRALRRLEVRRSAGKVLQQQPLVADLGPLRRGGACSRIQEWVLRRVGGSTLRAGEQRAAPQLT
jgi:hypothetical protein